MRLNLSEKDYISIAQKDEILDFLRRETDLDFTRYSEASARRRLARILTDLKVKDIQSYLGYLKADESARHDFVDKFTVNVTEMFRDPEVYHYFRKHILPAMVARNQNKIWCAGCSTGEEVLSLAITLQEENRAERFTISGTDISEKIIAQARLHQYKKRHIISFEKHYQQSGGTQSLNAYYSSLNEEWVEFSRDLYKNVKFEVSNLIIPSEGEKFDCIFCRNVLIYFNPALQNEVLKNLSNQLKPGGYLIIGAKESLVFYDHKNQFEEIKPEINIYQKHR